jgi:hypothetical protein
LRVLRAENLAVDADGALQCGHGLSTIDYGSELHQKHRDRNTVAPLECFGLRDCATIQ